MVPTLLLLELESHHPESKKTGKSIRSLLRMLTHTFPTREVVATWLFAM